MKEILIRSDYQRIGDVYYWDRSTRKWYGHPSSKSRWNVFVLAPVVLQHELTRSALFAGHDHEIFYPPKPKAVAKPKKTVKKKQSNTFISLF